MYNIHWAFKYYFLWM